MNDRVFSRKELLNMRILSLDELVSKYGPYETTSEDDDIEWPHVILYQQDNEGEVITLVLHDWEMKYLGKKIVTIEEELNLSVMISDGSMPYPYSFEEIYGDVHLIFCNQLLAPLGFFSEKDFEI